MSFVGMVLGAAVSGMLADRFGRKPVFQVSMIIWGLSSYLCSTAPLDSRIAAVAVTAAALVFFLGIETRGMALEELSAD